MVYFLIAFKTEVFFFGPKLGLHDPFRGLNIVLGCRDYHHSIRREIVTPWNDGLTFRLARILEFRMLYDPFFQNLTRNLSGHDKVSPIFYVAYATFQFETFKTQGRSSFYLIPPWHQLNRKIDVFSAFFAILLLTTYWGLYNGVMQLFNI